MLRVDVISPQIDVAAAKSTTMKSVSGRARFQIISTVILSQSRQNIESVHSVRPADGLLQESNSVLERDSFLSSPSLNYTDQK